jgi:hypothetical protein
LSDGKSKYNEDEKYQMKYIRQTKKKIRTDRLKLDHPIDEYQQKLELKGKKVKRIYNLGMKDCFSFSTEK